MDRERCGKILVGYGVGPRMLRLIVYFWDNAEMVCRALGRYGEPFKAGRGVTQGGHVSTKIFNIMVDAIIREWLCLVLDDEAAREEVQEAVRLFWAIFYADDGYILSRSARQLQESFDILIDLYERVGLRTNTKKRKS